MPDTFDAARPPSPPDSDGLYAIANGLENAPTKDMRKAFDWDIRMFGKPVSQLSRDYDTIMKMQDYYERQAEGAAEDEAAERQTLAHEQAAWRNSRGCV